MATVRTLIAGLLMFTTALASPALGQSRLPHVVDPSALASAVAERAAESGAQRAAIREALARPEVRSVAAHAGVDIDRLAAHVATLDGTDLAQVADAAQQVNHSLVGGASTVVISTTTIIIVLLVIILIVVAVD